MLGPIGNGIFVLISGYFLVPRGKNVSMTKSTKKLISQLVFAALVLMLSAGVAYQLTRNASDVFFALAPTAVITNMNVMCWFVGYYFTIILCGRLFLNGFLSGIDKTRYMETLLVLLGLVTFSWSGELLDGVLPGGGELCSPDYSCMQLVALWRCIIHFRRSLRIVCG